MNYFVAVRMRGFYVTARRQSVPCELPIVIERDGSVLDADEELLRRGVRFGMATRQAKAIVQGAQFIPWKQDEYIVAQRSWLDLLMPYADTIEPADQHLAYLDFSAHRVDPEGVLRQMVIDLQLRTGLDVRVGSGRTKWVAELATRRGYSAEAVTHPSAYLASLPVSDLTPASPATREKLQFLGYPTIGAVQLIPIEILKKQFGKETPIIYEAAQGVGYDRIEAKYPEASVQASRRIEGGTSDLQVIHAVLDKLANQLSLLLNKTNSVSCEVTLILVDESGALTRVDRTIAKHLSKRTQILQFLIKLFESVKVTSVWAVKVILRNIVQRKESQMNLNEKQTSDPALVLQRLNAAFGEQSVMKASELRKPWTDRFLAQWVKSLGHTR